MFFKKKNNVSELEENSVSKQNNIISILDSVQTEIIKELNKKKIEMYYGMRKVEANTITDMESIVFTVIQKRKEDLNK